MKRRRTADWRAILRKKKEATNSEDTPIAALTATVVAEGGPAPSSPEDPDPTYLG
jgi:hypothetical protein